MNNSLNDLRHALSLMETALNLIDRSQLCVDVGAHLDLATQRLKAFLMRADASG